MKIEHQPARTPQSLTVELWPATAAATATDIYIYIHSDIICSGEQSLLTVRHNVCNWTLHQGPHTDTATCHPRKWSLPWRAVFVDRQAQRLPEEWTRRREGSTKKSQKGPFRVEKDLSQFEPPSRMLCTRGSSKPTTPRTKPSVRYLWVCTWKREAHLVVRIHIS